MYSFQSKDVYYLQYIERCCNIVNFDDKIVFIEK